MISELFIPTDVPTNLLHKIPSPILGPLEHVHKASHTIIHAYNQGPSTAAIPALQTQARPTIELIRGQLPRPFHGSHPSLPRWVLFQKDTQQTILGANATIISWYTTNISRAHHGVKSACLQKKIPLGRIKKRSHWDDYFGDPQSSQKQ